MPPDHVALALYESTARFHRETLRGLTAARSDLQGDQAKLWDDSLSVLRRQARQGLRVMAALVEAWHRDDQVRRIDWWQGKAQF